MRKEVPLMRSQRQRKQRRTRKCGSVCILGGLRDIECFIFWIINWGWWHAVLPNCPEVIVMHLQLKLMLDHLDTNLGIFVLGTNTSVSRFLKWWEYLGMIPLSIFYFLGVACACLKKYEKCKINFAFRYKWCFLLWIFSSGRRDEEREEVKEESCGVGLSALASTPACKVFSTIDMYSPAGNFLSRRVPYPPGEVTLIRAGSPPPGGDRVK